MSKYLMQAVSGGVGGDGTLKAWSSGTADWAAAGFPGPGTALYTAVRKVIRDDVLVTAGNGTELGRRIEWTGSIWAQRRFWITPDVDLTGTVDASTAINAALASRAGACVYLPEGSIRIADAITYTQNGSTLVGASETETQILCAGSETAWITTNSVIAPSIRNLCIRGLSSAAPHSSGVALLLTGSFAPKVENVHVTEMYDGVKVDGCYEASFEGRLWLRNLFGVKGLEVVGNSGVAERIIADNPYQQGTDSKVHRARVAGAAIVAGDTFTNNGLIFQCTANGNLDAGGGPTTVPGTTIANARTTNVTDGTATVRFIGRLIDWIYGGASVAGFTVQSCALLHGSKGFRQDGGNWWHFNHFEIDHPWTHGMHLSNGTGLRASGQSWMSSIFTGDGVLVDTGYDGDMHMAGARIFGAAGRGVLLQPGPVDCYFERLTIDTCGGLAGFLAGAAAGAGPKHFAIRNSRVKNCNFGIAALSSDADYFHVTGNDCEGNSTDIDMSGASGTNVVVDHNLPP
jgi:hypothetical protein